MSYRLLDAGGKIVCDPAIQSLYRNRSTLAGLWHQYFDYGRWKVKVLRAHPHQTRMRHLAPVGLVSTLALGAGLGLVSAPIRRLAILEVLLYGTATLGASVRYRDPLRPESALRLALIYPILHVAYGLGMLAGLVQLKAATARANV